MGLTAGNRVFSDVFEILISRLNSGNYSILSCSPACKKRVKYFLASFDKFCYTSA